MLILNEIRKKKKLFWEWKGWENSHFKIEFAMNKIISEKIILSQRLALLILSFLEVHCSTQNSPNFIYNLRLEKYDINSWKLKSHIQLNSDQIRFEVEIKRIFWCLSLELTRILSDWETLIPFEKKSKN